MAADEFERLKLGLENLLDDRDYLYRLVSTIDWDAQLDAVGAVLRQHRLSSESVSARIRALEDEASTHKGPYQHRIVDEQVDEMWRSSYGEAAISLSAIGMIVPMIETIFAQMFEALGEKYATRGMAPPDHKRWRLAGEHPDRWNVQCHFGAKKVRTDVTSGLKQLCDAAGVLPFLGPNDPDWMVALFHYRNQMFHGGFEWSIPQRQAFSKLIVVRKWDRYFTWSKSRDEPWICYLRDEVIDELPQRVFSILGSLGRFTKSLPYKLISDPAD